MMHCSFVVVFNVSAWLKKIVTEPYKYDHRQYRPADQASAGTALYHSSGVFVWGA